MGRQSQGVAKVFVDEEGKPRIVRDRGDHRDVQHFAARIAHGLSEHEPGVRADRGPECVGIARVHERGLDPEAGEGVLEQVMASAVERPGSDDVVARARDGRDGEVKRCLPARHREGAESAFEGRHSLLEHGVGGIREPGVDVAGALEVEEPRRVVGVGEDEGGALIDGRGPCPGRGIRRLPGMQAERVETEEARAGHGVKRDPQARVDKDKVILPARRLATMRRPGRRAGPRVVKAEVAEWRLRYAWFSPTIGGPGGRKLGADLLQEGGKFIKFSAFCDE